MQTELPFLAFVSFTVLGTVCGRYPSYLQRCEVSGIWPSAFQVVSQVGDTSMVGAKRVKDTAPCQLQEATRQRRIEPD